VIVSALSSERDRDRAFLLGAHAFVAKPFSPEIMADAVRGALASRRARLRRAL
jgi:two-component system, chemotaxis family, chemotaxis protein CheY